MRKAYFAGCRTRWEAEKLAPWAAVIEKVEGGYMVWESYDDYKTAMRQC